ncbi:MAG: hypothetical protein V1900_01980 [Candidatus Aenigmatarchaeota archaeon]
MIEVFVAGFLGGVIRGLVGITKYLTGSPSKKRRIRTDYLCLTLLSSGGLGLLMGFSLPMTCGSQCSPVMQARTSSRTCSR